MARVLTTVETARARFTALQQPLAFFDGPGGTQVPDSVIDAIATYLREANANVGGPFSTSQASDALVDHAHETAAEFLNATADEVAFGANMTTLNFALSRAASREWQAGDEIVCTRLDHDGNVAPWLEIAHDRDLTVRFADVDDECRLDLGTARIAAERAHAGRRVPLGVERGRHADARSRDREARARRRRARVGRRRSLRAARPDRRAGRRRGRRALLAVQVLRAAPRARVRPSRAARVVAPLQGSARTGSARRPSLRDRDAGPRAARGIRRRGRLPGRDRLGLRARARACARRSSSSPGYRRRGRCTASRRWTTACRRSRSRTGRVSPQAAAERLGERGFAVWHGNYYAVEIMRRLGLDDGAVRVGIVHYNTEDEVQRLLAELAAF